MKIPLFAQGKGLYECHLLLGNTEDILYKIIGVFCIAKIQLYIR